MKKTNVALCEAEVGTGKTFAYLLSAIIFRLSKDNAIENMKDCSKKITVLKSIKLSKPIVISTSSIALQRALIEDYIPEISKILIKWRILQDSLLAGIRKGKGRYVCDKRLEDCIRSIEDKPEYKKLRSLLEVSYREIDLDEYNNF